MNGNQELSIPQIFLGNFQPTSPDFDDKDNKLNQEVVFFLLG